MQLWAQSGRRSEDGCSRDGRRFVAKLANSRPSDRFVSSASQRSAVTGSLYVTLYCSYSFLCINKPCKKKKLAVWSTLLSGENCA